MSLERVVATKSIAGENSSKHSFLPFRPSRRPHLASEEEAANNAIIKRGRRRRKNLSSNDDGLNRLNTITICIYLVLTPRLCLSSGNAVVLVPHPPLPSFLLLPKDNGLTTPFKDFVLWRIPRQVRSCGRTVVVRPLISSQNAIFDERQISL